MPYIAREDGEHFVIPSYRDVLTAKQKSVIQKDVISLSQSYGEFITMQRKGPQQYEVAFSPDRGYLLGETVWHQFKRPLDMIYCEAVPNSAEAILVIVKGGSVYLDGSFPMESIPEELIIFLTQQNNFEVFVYGDVPISETPTEGKFSFDPASVKSFTVLDQPVFSSLPLLKAYQFQPVLPVLKSHGIGGLPMMPIFMGLMLIGLGWMMYGFWNREKPPEIQMEVNPYQGLVDALASPAPDQAMAAVVNGLKLFTTAPGWTVKQLTYTAGTIDVMMLSSGNSIENLMDWANQNKASFVIKATGISLSIKPVINSRAKPDKVYPSKEVLAIFMDRLQEIYPGDHLKLVETKAPGPYSNTKLNISIVNISPMLIGLIGEQFKGLPFTLDKVDLTVKDGLISGTISAIAYGS
jgi:hypothetical protein